MREQMQRPSFSTVPQPQPLSPRARTWQTNGYMEDRRSIIHQIIQLLQERRPQAQPEWLQKLPMMAKRLEESLFLQAPSHADYMDESTLTTRLQLLAISMGVRAASVGGPTASAAPAAEGSIPPFPVEAAATSSPQPVDLPLLPPERRAQLLEQQQQRLLLLRHASKCSHDGPNCPATPHCAAMRSLWRHIAECNELKCNVPHCVSSRCVLSHYHRCRELTCVVCGPVRESIH
ncbi:unnamed protein product, partial [Phaeothamnion confervicola]